MMMMMMIRIKYFVLCKTQTARLTVVVKEHLYGFFREVGIDLHAFGQFEDALAPERARIQLQTDERKYGQNEDGQDCNVA